MGLREVRYEMVKASTNTTDTVVVVWWDSEVKHCVNQDYWHEGTVPTVWDTTGLGSWDLASRMQCGNCGLYFHPPAEVLVDPSEGDIAEARANVYQWR